nr:biotin--[acetyl-CoA-carboxylase] ligase [uncultured Blautia sp.]
MSVKSRLLELLEQNRGITISGEQMARELECTRAAVWKAVKALQQEGYEIEAGPNKGYMLSEDNNILAEEGIRPLLRQPEVYLKLYQETDSTNRAAKQAAIAGEAGHGSVILACGQSCGRGRRGRSFYSPSQAGLYLSVILQPQGNLRESLLLTTEAAVAVYKAVRKITGIELDIKWVNDLYYKGKKVCGILTEAITDFESGEIQYAVVGIGLNLYEEEGGYPPELRGIAGGLYRNQREAEDVNRNRLAAEIVNCLLDETRELKLLPEYLSRNIVPGHRIQILDGKQSRSAYALAICQDGRLKVRERDGSESFLSYGEVSVIVE